MKTEHEIEQEILNQVAHLRWAASQGYRVPICDIEELPTNPNNRTVFPRINGDELIGNSKGGIENCCYYKHIILEGEPGFVEQPRRAYDYARELQFQRRQIDTIFKNNNMKLPEIQAT
jgi:hypothetical protein